jgi:4'-phosphopantetheinyl transferase
MHPGEDPSEAIREIALLPFSLDDEQGLPLALAESWLSTQERERAARFRFDVHRHRYIRGRGRVRAVLGRRLGLDPAALSFAEGERGKPRLLDGALEFNLSHSEDRAALVVAEPMPSGALGGIGVDLERYDRRVDVPGLARRCFVGSENAWLASFPEETRHLGFFRLWTAKEARMKASGEGFQLEPRRIELAFAGDRPARYLAPAAPAAWLESIELDAAVCAVAAFGPFRLVRMQGDRAAEWE